MEATMTNRIKLLSAIVVLSAAVATPVFAQDANVSRPHHARVHHQENFRGSYNQSSAQSNAAFYAQPLTNDERRNVEFFVLGGGAPPRGGGEARSLNPGS